MSRKLEQSFNVMLDAIAQGTFKNPRIDLRGVPLSKSHTRNLAQAFEANFQITSNITEIDLSFSGIAELPDDIFRDCDALKRLNLDNNKLHKLPKLPDRPYALQDFFAGNNPLKTIPNNYFANCISLKAVYLNDTQLTEAPLFSDSMSLAWLHLNANPIKKFPEKYFANLAWLDTVFINDTKLKHLPNLSTCPRLHEVWIDDIDVPQKNIMPTAQVIKCKLSLPAMEGHKKQK